MPLDVMNHYFSCLRGRFGPQKFTGSVIKKHVLSPFITYCDAHISSEFKDLEPPFVRLLASLGQNHEKKIVQERFSNAIKCPYLEGKEAFLLALKLMAKKVQVLSGFPFYFVRDQFMGYLDLIRLNEAHASIFGEYYYEVIEIKAAKRINLEHILQAAYYNLLIGKVQQYIPPTFYLINGEGEEKEYNYVSYESQLEEVLNEVQQIWRGHFIPPAIYSDSLRDYPWQSYENRLALDKQDVSLIPGVSTSLRQRLNETGYTSISQMACSNETDLQRIKGIKSKAKKLLARAQALTMNKIILIDPPTSLTVSYTHLTLPTN